MTRKRYKKLLMAEGYSRNEAEAIVWAAWAVYGEYQTAYNKAKGTNSIIQQAQDAMDGLKKAIDSLAPCLFNVLASVADTMANIMAGIAVAATAAAAEYEHNRQEWVDETPNRKD